MAVKGWDIPVVIELVARAVALVMGILLTALVAWVIGKHYVWRLRRAAARRGARRERTRPDGQPYPPTGMGICSECETAGQDVYHLPSGQRLCKDCYARIEGFSNNGTTDASASGAADNAAGSKT